MTSFCFFLSLLQQYGEDEEEDEDEEGTVAEGEESNEGSGDINEPFEGDDTEVHHLTSYSFKSILILHLIFTFVFWQKGRVWFHMFL